MTYATLDWIDACYAVTDDGRVFSDKRSGERRQMSLRKAKNGYLYVSLRAGRHTRTFSVHRLVLRAFSGIDGPQCNHKDGDRLNNHVDNLEWCTSSENHRHSFLHLGRRGPMLGKSGAAHNRSRGVIQLAKDGTLVGTWGSMQEAARNGFLASQICKVCSGKYKTHRGFIWQYSQPGV